MRIISARFTIVTLLAASVLPSVTFKALSRINPAVTSKASSPSVEPYPLVASSADFFAEVNVSVNVSEFVTTALVKSALAKDTSAVVVSSELMSQVSFAKSK